MDDLIGQKILKVEVGGCESILRFTTVEKDYTYLTEADCCSETWFSEIINLDFLVNHTVSAVEQLAMPHFVDGNCRQDEDSLYGVRVATEAGHCTIAFRNSSNGYYGGSFSLASQEAVIFDPQWKDISNLPDWTACETRAGSYYSYLKLKAFW